MRCISRNLIPSVAASSRCSQWTQLLTPSYLSSRTATSSSSPHSPLSLSPASIPLTHIDHLVLTVRSIPATIAFYTSHFNCRASTFGPQLRHQLSFGPHKLNLHEAGKEFEPKAVRPTPGSVDLCLVTQMRVEEVKDRLEKAGVEVVEGVVDRTGAMGPIRSVYCRDPDGNLLEICNY